MRTTTLKCTIAGALLLWAPRALAQHEDHTPQAPQPSIAAAEQLTACVQSQQRVMSLLDAADHRLEMARQTNEPAAMRAAVDELQATLSAMRSQLVSCAQLAAAAPPAGASATHAMPSAALAKDPRCVDEVDPKTAPQASHDGKTYYFCSETARQLFVADPVKYMQGASTSPTPPGPPKRSQETGGRGLTIAFRSVPDPPRGAAENQFEVIVKDRQGKPVDGAEVSLLFYIPAMPSMRMPEMRNEVALAGAGDGTYKGAGQIMMAGPWTLTVSVRQDGQEIGQAKVAIAAK